MKEGKKSGWAPFFLALLLLMAVFSGTLASCDALVDIGNEEPQAGENWDPDPDPPLPLPPPDPPGAP